MVSRTGSNPEDEYADDEYADYDAEDHEQPSVTAEIPDDEPEDDVLEQRHEVPCGDKDGNANRYSTGPAPVAGRRLESAPAAAPGQCRSTDAAWGGC